MIGILNEDGTVAARYTYDAWGKPLSITDGNGVDVSEDPNHIANLNPLRYRGYYWDQETGLYYCQSRYYDPVTGRWINADGLVSTGQGILGNNMFAYCLNNPIGFADPTGATPEEAEAWAKTSEAILMAFKGLFEPYYKMQYVLTYNALYAHMPPYVPPKPAPAPAKPDKVWPAPGNTTVSSGFGKRNTGIPGASKQHNGIDVTAPKGAPVVAAISGKITIPKRDSKMGIYMVITNDQYVTRYQHLSKITWDIEAMGSDVIAGQQIGEVGSTGVSSGPHLHFGVQENGNWINPMESFFK